MVIVNKNIESLLKIVKKHILTNEDKSELNSTIYELSTNYIITYVEFSRLGEYLAKYLTIDDDSNVETRIEWLDDHIIKSKIKLIQFSIKQSPGN